MKPKPTLGIRHLALFIQHFDECLRFYTELLGMTVEWQPDADNVYLTSGSDNLALHRAAADFAPSKHQRLDHLGFIIKTPAEVDEWYEYLSQHQVKMHSQVKTHRDGARSFYCADPDGNVVQMIYHPPISDQI